MQPLQKRPPVTAGMRKVCTAVAVAYSVLAASGVDGSGVRAVDDGGGGVDTDGHDTRGRHHAGLAILPAPAPVVGIGGAGSSRVGADWVGLAVDDHGDWGGGRAVDSAVDHWGVAGLALPVPLVDAGAVVAGGAAGAGIDSVVAAGATALLELLHLQQRDVACGSAAGHVAVRCSPST